MFDKTKKFVKKPSITPLTFVLIVISISQDIVEASEWYQVAFGVIMPILLVLSGVSVSDVKALLLRFKSVLQNKALTLTQKFVKIFDITISGCAMLGVIQEEMNLYPNEYFVKQLEKEVKANNAITKQ